MIREVSATAASDEQALEILDDLAAAGIGRERVRAVAPVMMTPPGASGGVECVASQPRTRVAEGVAIGAAIGVVLGAGVGWLMWAGALPSLGLRGVIGAGPFLALTGVALIGAAIGAGAGVLIGRNIPETHSRPFASSAGAGPIYLSVQVDDTEDAQRTTRVLEHHGARSIAVTTEEGEDDSPPASNAAPHRAREAG